MPKKMWSSRSYGDARSLTFASVVDHGLLGDRSRLRSTAFSGSWRGSVVVDQCSSACSRRPRSSAFGCGLYPLSSGNRGSASSIISFPMHPLERLQRKAVRALLNSSRRRRRSRFELHTSRVEEPIHVTAFKGYHPWFETAGGQSLPSRTFRVTGAGPRPAP